jgi:hypothetical protein
MMKKGIAFVPISDIQKFITENICDVNEKIDVTKMQNDVREYQKHIKIAELIENKINILQQINDAYSEMLTCKSKLKIQQYIVARSNFEDKNLKIKVYANEIHAANLKIGEYKQKDKLAEERIELLDKQIKNLEQDEKFGDIKFRISNLNREIDDKKKKN